MIQKCGDGKLGKGFTRNAPKKGSNMTQTFQDGYVKWIRSHIGNQLIYLVYSTAFVFNEKGHLLVQERYDFDWLSVPGGAMEIDESLLDCVRRETFEETGVDCTVERFVGIFSHPNYNLVYPNGDQVQCFTAAFVCHAKTENIQVDGQETLQAAFRPVDEVRDRFPLMYKDMLAAIEHHPTEAHLEAVYSEAILQPYYPILREKVGAESIILPGTTAAIFNEDGQILAIKKGAQDYWNLPAGLSDLGETTTATVVREVLEETGFIVEPTRIIGIYSHPDISQARFPNGEKAHSVDLLIECNITGGEFKPDGVEVELMQFMDIEALAAQEHITPLRQQMYADLRIREQAPFIR